MSGLVCHFELTLNSYGNVRGSGCLVEGRLDGGSVCSLCADVVF